MLCLLEEKCDGFVKRETGHPLHTQQQHKPEGTSDAGAVSFEVPTNTERQALLDRLLLQPP